MENSIDDVSKTVEIFNSEEDIVKTRAPMIKERYGHSVVSVRSKIVVIGGNIYGYRSNSCEVLNSKTNQFRMISSMKV